MYALMNMPERTFGRTVRYRRNKLGMSHAQLAELVGRSTSTIRSWERDKSRPNDPQVVATLAAILGVDERQLFEKADVEPVETFEISPTIEEALASLSIEEAPSGDEETRPVSDPVAEPAPLPITVHEYKLDLVELKDHDQGFGSTEAELVRERALVGAVDAPGFVAPPDPYVQTPLTPSLTDASYMEDNSQRQLYRVRNLATLVAVVALIVTFIWALGEGIGALGDWWDDFFGNLRL